VLNSLLVVRNSLFAIRLCSERPMPDPAHALTLQFLAWVAEAPRTYGQGMEAWRSSCPRLSIWEDAILDGLVGFEGGATRNQSRVALTPKGRALLRAGEVAGGREPRVAEPRVAEPRVAEPRAARPRVSALVR
jgi:hypothetical protein